jgi:hypothetical protein
MAIERDASTQKGTRMTPRQSSLKTSRCHHALKRFPIYAAYICIVSLVISIIVPSYAEAQTQLIPRNRLDQAVAAPNHVRFVYAVPFDGSDKIRDMNGSLQATVEAMQDWMAERADGMKLRIRMIDGRPEVLFVRLEIQQDKPGAAKRTKSEGRAATAQLRRAIEDELRRANILKANEIFAVLYDGLFFGECGIAPRAQAHEYGLVVLVNLNTFIVPELIDCLIETDENRQLFRGLHVALLHEVFHGLGAVPDCAPDTVIGTGHDNLNSRDLMYARPTADSPSWAPQEIDARRRNCFGHGRANCLDLAKSPFLMGGK